MLLGIDVAFSHTGFVVLNPASGSIIASGCIVTKKEHGRTSLRVRVSDSDFRRCREIAAVLIQQIACHRVTGIVAELPTGGAIAARSARTMGMASGVLAGVAEAIDIPVEVYSPQEVKLAACGVANASKDAVIKAMCKKWPALVGCVKPNSLLEHTCDAAAVLLAAEQGILYKSIRRSLGDRKRRFLLIGDPKHA